MTSRAQILLLSRLGAEERAWASFRAGGWDSRTDPEALLLEARLLKDRAMRAEGAGRQSLFRAAADRYAAAAQGRSTYALINAASLAMLGGEHGLGQARAREVVAMIERGQHEPDTAYWLGATLAEALLLLEDPGGADRALGQAIATTPRGWEDHAVTLRQFELLLAAMDLDDAWLDAHRPGPVLYFAGIMGIESGDRVAAERIAAAVAALRPSAGVGALAAGADILAAEALLELGVDYHVVLPCEAERFRAESVAVAGEGWTSRFDRLLAQASSIEVTAIAAEATGEAIDLADQVAMGMAIGLASELATRPVALRMLDDDGIRAAQPAECLWRSAGHEMVIARINRSREPRPPAPEASERSVAVVAIRQGAASRSGHMEEGDALQFRFASLGEALRKAQTLVAGTDNVAGLDFRLASDMPERDLAAAIAGAEAGVPGSIVATRHATAALRLHGRAIAADLLGEVRTAFGIEEMWSLRLPRDARLENQ